MPSRRGPRLAWLLAWAWMTGCFGLGPIDCGFRGTVGGPCNPLAPAPQCGAGQFCSRLEFCTSACVSDSQCRARCSVDADGITRGCRLGDTCNAGTCSSDTGVRCRAGFCQPACGNVLPDGGCDWDLYGPSDYAREE